ncbi:hypothetical protein NECID01_1151 [Nematocida sp. AWRm77]|nr:hypothetical protein NECID01_1151 [Nematocida sp. AWRm77]
MPSDYLPLLSGTSWSDVKAVQFFLFPAASPSAEWQLTKVLNNMEKRFIRVGRLSYTKIQGVIVKVMVDISAGAPRDSVFSGIQEAFSQTVVLTLPVHFLSGKERLLLEFERISSWNSTCIETFVQNDFSVNISGTNSQVFKTKIDILNLIEKFQGRSPQIFSSHINAASLINSGARVYFETKILSKKAVVSRSINETFVSAAKKPEESVLKTSLTIDRIKFVYLVTYIRASLEDILVKNEAYIEEVRDASEAVEVVVSSLAKKNLACAVSEILMLCSSIVTVHIQKMSPHSAAKVFVLDLGTSIVIVGESAEVKQVLREINLPCRLMMGISAPVEEFICGKKNGKINKVARESQCVLSIQKDPELSLVIQGCARNVEFSLALVEDELPAEYSFYLHEKHHKRIIGYGGKSIQRLMKKHGVYIKFDSSTNTNHNVIIKTPKKNKESLYKMYKDVMELAGEVPVMSLGIWSSLSYLDFYAVGFGVYSLESQVVKVFTKDPVDVQYYLLEPEEKKETKAPKVYSIEEKVVVASEKPLEIGKLITPRLWSKNSSLSTYFSRDHGDPLFSEDGLWGRKWKSSFLDTWQTMPWRGKSFSRM